MCRMILYVCLEPTLVSRIHRREDGSLSINETYRFVRQKNHDILLRIQVLSISFPRVVSHQYCIYVRLLKKAKKASVWK